MKKQQSGFTLIELIAVIVILGILAATAVPKFIDLSDAASESGVNGLAGSLSSASSVNFAAYSACAANLTGATTDAIVDTTTTSCLNVATALAGTIDPNYGVDNVGTFTGTDGESNTCRVYFDSNGDGDRDGGEPFKDVTLYSVDDGGLPCP